jgi:malate dehydrogenase (oxaloacetate-decarboxylating)
MAKVNLTLDNLDALFADRLPPDRIDDAKTLFMKKLALKAHGFYSGKMQSVPKAGIYGHNWFNVWYTPGVSAISTTIRDNNDTSYELSNRGNSVAVVSDSTRVLGDGDCTPPGGLGVMEGKAFLMKYLGGVDATALCVDSRDKNGEHSADKIIEFVKMAQYSFGAINLEDISQPNCFRVLDTLRKECDIPVWHDDAQGTACVTLAGLINALKIVEKEIADVRIVMLGAGASNTTIARLIIAAGGDPDKIVMFDSKGSLHTDREDLKTDTRFYRKWELCEQTNPKKYTDVAAASKGADVFIALSRPGPGIVKPQWISSMADKSIVFVCSNPVPEIYPYDAKKAGAYIVATGRGDFANQVNNSVGFPGIVKGALLVRARNISDDMAIVAAHAIADFAEARGIDPDNIIAKMDETGVFAHEAAEVAAQAVKEGHARVGLTRKQVYEKARADIKEARALIECMIERSFIKPPPQEFIQDAFEESVREVS